MGMSTRQIPYVVSAIALLCGGVLFFAFPIRNLFSHYAAPDQTEILIAVPVAATAYMSLLYLFVVATFFLASFVDPGIYPREHTEDEDDFRTPLYKQIEIHGVQVKMKWCESCKFYRPPRCSHCSICDNCVEGFDHHCPWVDNCIGRRNYKYFFFFVTSLTIFILSGFAWALLSILVNRDDLKRVVVEFILIFFGLLVFVPVVGLTGFHMGLVCMGRTTNEHVTGKFRGVVNPYDRGCVVNCLFALCSPKKPRYMHYRAKMHAPVHNLTRASTQSPRNPNNEFRCMPVYEELDPNATRRVHRQPQPMQQLSSTAGDPIPGLAPGPVIAVSPTGHRQLNGGVDCSDSSVKETISPSASVHTERTMTVTEIAV